MRLFNVMLAWVVLLIAAPAWAQSAIPSADGRVPGKVLSVTLAIGGEARASYTCREAVTP